MPTSFHAVKCRCLHCMSLKLDMISPTSISPQHELLIGFELGPSVQIKGDVWLDSLSKKTHCVYCETLSAHLLMFNVFCFGDSPRVNPFVS